MADKGRLEQARTLLKTASNNFYAADSLFKQYADWQSYCPQIISHCVECIEWSAKALWFAFTASYPKEHDLTEQRAKRHESVVGSNRCLLRRSVRLSPQQCYCNSLYHPRTHSFVAGYRRLAK